MKQIIFTNVNYNGNAGDFWSTPLKYYNFNGFPIKHVHFMDIWESIQNTPNHEEYLIKDSLVVIGGGGLITTQGNFLQETTEFLVKNNKVIFWGVGSNTFEKPSYDILNHPNVILSGIRDIVCGLNVDYLPCVSCKHPLFDKDTLLTFQDLIKLIINQTLNQSLIFYRLNLKLFRQLFTVYIGHNYLIKKCYISKQLIQLIVKL